MTLFKDVVRLNPLWLEWFFVSDGASWNRVVASERDQRCAELLAIHSARSIESTHSEK